MDFTEIPEESRKDLEKTIEDFRFAVIRAATGQGPQADEDQFREWLVIAIREACSTAHCRGQGLC
jgi:hypothetical protein